MRRPQLLAEFSLPCPRCRAEVCSLFNAGNNNLVCEACLDFIGNVGLESAILVDLEGAQVWPKSA